MSYEDSLAVVRAFEQWREERTLDGLPATALDYAEHLRFRDLEQAIGEIRDILENGPKGADDALWAIGEVMSRVSS